MQIIHEIIASEIYFEPGIVIPIFRDDCRRRFLRTGGNAPNPQTSDSSSMAIAMRFVFVLRKAPGRIGDAFQRIIRFMSIGVDVDSITDTDLMRMQAVFQNENSLVFGFSIGGQKEEVIFLLKEAKKRGAKTVLFTANNRDDYKEFCTEVLLIPSLRHLNHGNVISPQFPILIMIDIIYSYYVEQDKTKKKILHDRTVQALEETYTEKAE